MEIKNPYIISSEKCETNRKDNDLIVKSIGAFGIWQAVVCVLASLTRVIPIWNSTAYVFIAPAVSFKCIEFENLTIHEVEPKQCYENCAQYEYKNLGLSNNLLKEFDLICKDGWLASFTQTVLMFGLLVGATLFGWISDRYGRRTALLLAICLNTFSAIGVSFVLNYWLFNFLRLFIGIASGGILVISVVIVMETVGSKYRDLAGCLIFTVDPLAECSMAVIAILTDNWNVFMFCVAAICSLFLVYVFLIPEMPRWLIVNGMIDEATASMTRAADWNKLPTVDIPQNVKELIIQSNSTNLVKSNYKHLLTNRDLVIKLCYTGTIWFILGLCYSGISQYITFIGKNIYISVLVSGLVQFPTNFVAILFNKYFGRKYTIIMSFGLNTVSMAALCLVSNHWSSILGFIGLFSTSITFTTIYIFTSELFPTSVRNMSLGLNSGGARLGAMSAPFIARMESNWIPSLLFASLSIIAIVPCFLLPETKGCELKDSVEE